MKRFTKQETIALFIIFFFLLVISIPNFVLSIKRARDNSRKADMGNVVTALNEYQEDFGSFPLSTPDGKILACKRPEDKFEYDEMGKLKIDLIVCEWGKDGIFDYTSDPVYPYLSSLPNDPKSNEGYTYFYISNGRRYQIYTHLEAIDDDQYDERILSRNLSCGSKICNSGRGYSNTPVDISLEEYELKINAR